MIYSHIAGTGGYLPEKLLTNADLAKMVDTTDEWIMSRVGIRERHIAADGETTASMATMAARRAIEAAGIEVNDVGLVVVGTTTPDFTFPSVAALVQRDLGITNETPAFDLQAACSGFIYGLSIADQYIKTGAVKHALVIGADCLSRTVDWTDRSTCVLFGDGAGAVVLSADEKPGILSTKLHANGEYADLLFADNHLWKDDPKDTIQMTGNAVFKIAVQKLGGMVDDVLADSHIDKSQVDWLIPHQANMRIIQAAAKRLNLPMEQVVLTIEKHGNTSAASIPLAFDHAVRIGQVKRGNILFLEAFGAGLAWGSALVQY